MDDYIWQNYDGHYGMITMGDYGRVALMEGLLLMIIHSFIT